MPDSFDEMIRNLEAHMDSLFGDMHNLHQLPAKMRDSVEDFWNQLSQNGSLPNPSSLFSIPAKEKAAPPPPPPLSLSQKASKALAKHPYLYSSIALSIPVLSYVYVRRYMPRLYNKYFNNLFPAWPKAEKRPITNSGDIRLEAVLVLGADDGTLGQLVALDLARRGFIVIASVQDREQISTLEPFGKGFVKAIEFDPTDLDAVSTFIQNVNTALSLRFPLHSPGDPFQAQRMLSLSAFINCLPIAAHCSVSNWTDVWPLEATSVSTFARTLTGTVVATFAVLQGVLPLLRQSTNPSVAASPARVLTLLPTTTSRIALPFIGAQSAADMALLNLVDSFRREIKCATTGSKSTSTAAQRQLCFTNLDVGFFDVDQVAQSSARPTEEDELPRHLKFYSPAISRRASIVAAYGGAKSTSRIGSPVDHLLAKIFKLVTSSQNHHRTSVGAGSLAYRIASRLPTFVVDSYLASQDYIASVLHRPSFRATRRPLPSPPATTLDKSKSSLQSRTISLPSDMSLPPTASGSRGTSSHTSDEESRRAGDADDEMSNSLASLASSQGLFGQSAVLVDRSAYEDGENTYAS